MELGLTANTLNNVKQRHTQQNAQLSNMLADIAEAPIEEVAMQMLAMQNRLQASFQVTSMVSQLTLVNYLR
jgi:flagellar hook-associated protein 3 FlgL